MPAAVCFSLKIFRDFGGDRARHHADGEFDHVHLEPLCPRGGREFEADKTGADDDDALPRRNPVPQRFALIQRAQVSHRFEIGIWNIEQAVARAGRQHEMAVIERRAGGERDLARRAVDRNGAVDDQIDFLVVIEFFRPEHQGVRPAGSLQIGL